MSIQVTVPSSQAPRSARGLGLFDGYGIEIEYMIADRESLAVRGLSDHVLSSIAGSFENEVEAGALRWSNELVLHVIELKTNGPVRTLSRVSELFQADVRRVNEILEPLGAMLMPTAMHPLMNPDVDTRLWPHGYNEVYAAYDRIFDCRGHGWSNLQSVHLNLPFACDVEFARLHTAVRLLLPILPGLAASSPYMEGKATGFLDNRMEVYRQNSSRIPSIPGHVVPEAVSSRAEYIARILEPMYCDIAPFDPAGVLQEEWLNSRGAIARFDRNTIEIRVLDVQECPQADLAICSVIASVLQALVREIPSSQSAQASQSLSSLVTHFLATIRDADEAIIDDSAYLSLFGFPEAKARVGELWRFLADRYPPAIDSGTRKALHTILEAGPLARRMLRRAGLEPSRSAILDLSRELSVCLREGRLLF